MKIIAAAIKFIDKKNNYPQIMTAKRHGDVFSLMRFYNIDYDKKSAVQGFLTDENTFVNRYEAKKIAVAANQLIVPIEQTHTELYSEDLW